MNSVRMNQLIYRGLGKAAQRIGPTCTVYRPASALLPISPENIVTTLPASFTTSYNFSKPNSYGQPTWQAILDGTQVEAGDYIVGPDGTWFIAAKQPLLPILAVDCPRTVDIFRPQKQSGAGKTGYGGNTSANQQTLATQWPMSELKDSKGRDTEADLPADVSSAWWTFLLPPIPGVTLANRDIIADDIGRRFLINTAELSDLGWRMTALQAMT